MSEYKFLWHRQYKDEEGLHGSALVILDECELGLEYNMPCNSYGGFSFTESDDGDPIMASLRMGLFGVYTTVSCRPLQTLIDGGREFSIDFQNGGVFWNMGATVDTPRWRNGSWHPVGHFRRHGEPELIEECVVLIPMPERSYRANARLERSLWGFERLPRVFDKVRYSVVIRMCDGEQIGSHYCIYCDALDIEEGIGIMVASVLRDREPRL